MSSGPHYKVVLLGEAGVGKTTLFLRLKDGVFYERAKTTSGVESCSKYYTIRGTKVKLEIWDTAGVERFRTMTANYYRNAQAAVFVYSTDNMSSIQLLPQWVDDTTHTAPNALKFLLGNKSDLKPEIESDSAQDFADIYNCECASKASAKTGDGVEEVFKTIATKLLEQRQRSHLLNEVDLFDTSTTLSANESKSKCCT